MSGQRYTFEGWTLDCGRGALTTANGDVALRPKAFEVLRFLIENAGQLVSHDDVLTAVWPGVSATEESLTKCVSEVRQALGESGQRFIKTVPKRGYIFEASVTNHTATAFSETATMHRLLDGPSVVVLPFTNLSGDASQEYLSDGITEDIISGLSYFTDLSVIGRNSSFSYKGRAIDVREVGQQLGVRYIVEGSVRKFGDQIRITAQLVDAQSRIRRWGERFDRALGDVFAVQDEITQSIVRIVVAHVGNAETERVLRKPPNSWTAYDLTMRGDQKQRELEQSWEQPVLYEMRQLFAEAFRIDPDNARICAKLAHTYIRAYSDPASQECGDPTPLKQGHELANKAVGLDPSLPLARTQLGWSFFWMKQLDVAIREIENAVALNPNHFEFPYPAIFVYAGAPLRTLDILQAQLRLDPFYPPQMHAIRGHALYMLKRYEEALMPLRECLRRGPHVVLGQLWLSATLVRLGQRTEARAIAKEVLKQIPRLTLNGWPALSVYRDPKDADHVIEALRDAGIP